MLKVHIRRTLIAMLIAGLLGFVIAVRSPKLYEASVEVLAGSPQIQMDQTMPIAVKKAMSGVITDLDSETGIMKSQRIFRQGLERASKQLTGATREGEALNTARTFQELYPMYDLDIPASLNTYAPDQQRVVRIRVRAFSPQDAAAVANGIALEFADYRKKRAADAVRDALDMVSGQAKKAKAQLDNIDRQYRDLKLDLGVADMREGDQQLTGTLEAQRTRRSALTAQIAGSVAQVSILQSQLARTERIIKGPVSNISDPRIDLFRQMLSSAEVELNTLRQTWAEEAPIVAHAKEKVTKLRKELTDAEKNPKQVKQGSNDTLNSFYLDLQSRLAVARSELASYREQVGPISANISELETRIAKSPAAESKAFEMQRNRMVYEEQYQKNQKWVEDLQSAKEGSTSQIQSLADAELITEPVAPDTKKYVILAAIVGSLIGLAYSFAMESFRLPVHTSWQLAELTALPVAASIPMMPKPLARRHYSEIRDSNFKPIESFRYMAFSMMAKENRPGVILFTAVGEDVDSTGAAAEFAVAMAKTGSKTVLVDCDLRLPRLSELFGVNGRSGVAEILGRTILPGESTDLFVATEHDNLMILPAGAASPSGLSDFNTSHMSGLIEDLREKADTVVINCPPVDVFADASRLAQYVDETCLVISAKTTSYRAIPVAQEILQKSGAKDMSIVLTNGSPTEEPFGTRSGASVARR